MSNFETFLTYFNAYSSLLIIICALVGNTVCFLIFRFTKSMKNSSTMIYLSFVAITDTLSLVTWNLDHFLFPIYGVNIEYSSVFNCKFFIFLQLATITQSSYLIAYMNVDRYFTIAALPGSRLPFGTKKSAYIVSTVIVTFISILALPILILNGVSEEKIVNATTNQSINSSTIFRYDFVCYFIKPDIFDAVLFYVTCLPPFLIMIAFNTLIVRKIIQTGSSQSTRHKSKKLMKTSVTLFLLSFLFIIMTMPTKICFGYFLDYFRENNLRMQILTLIDNIGFSYNSSLFIIFFM